MITFCLGFRNWHSDHLTRCLLSLARFKRRIIVTLGHEHEDHFVIDPRVNQGDVPVEWIHRPMREWSRSYALNEAAKLVTTRYICFTDADMIFPSHWLGVAEEHAARQPLGFFLTDSRDLDDVYFPISDEALWYASTPHDRIGQGGAMLVAREWFERVGGFDEFYKTWGCDDNDLTLRAQWGMLDVTWLPNTFVAHQWHRRDWPTPEQIQQVERNRAYLRARIEQGGPIVRNTVV